VAAAIEAADMGAADASGVIEVQLEGGGAARLVRTERGWRLEDPSVLFAP
jgi:hypothetical protein